MRGKLYDSLAWNTSRDCPTRSTRNAFAPAMFSANFQTTYTLVAWGRPVRPAGPRGGGAIAIFEPMGSRSFSAERVMEMAFITNDDCPASIARLFEDGSQASTAGVIASR